MDQHLPVIEIRPVNLEDGRILYKLMTTDKWIQFVGDRGVATLEDARRYIKNKMHPDLKVKGFVNHIIIDQLTQKEVGTCSLHNRRGVEGMDIGYAILEEYEGKGYATAGARAMVKLAFSKYHAKKISAITIEENVGSCRVLEKLGFEAHGFLFLPNDAAELKLYQLDKAKWNSLESGSAILP
jgi:RimJ/RimL family protein N-acetyltransferase